MAAMRQFLWKTAFFVVLIAGGFELLYRAGYLPVITDSMYFDNKMAWVQRHPLGKVDLAVVGASVPLYGIDSKRLADNLDLSYFNFSSWNVKMTECRFIVQPIVLDYRPKYVLVGSNLGDFCGLTDTTYLRYTRAARWMRRDMPELFYLLDFHSVHQIAYRKEKVENIDFDRWGGGNWPFDRRVLKGKIPDGPGSGLEPLPDDPQNQAMHYAALDSMSRWLREEGVRMIFLQFPIMAANLADSGVRARVDRHIGVCRSIVEGRGGVFLNYCDSFRCRDTLFAGPIHLRPSGAVVISGMLVRDLKTIMRQ
jgi:hypothetical protein